MECRAALVFSLITAAVLCQGPPTNGPRSVDAGWFALVNGTVKSAPGAQGTPATVVLRGGLVTAVGGATPEGAQVVDCTGLTIYPGLVESFLPIDVPALDPATGDVHWNPMVQAQRNALEGAGIPSADRDTLRGLGFTTVAIAPSGGILKGTSSVVLLDDATETERPRVVRSHGYELCSLQTNRGGYPGSEMGAIALLRQTLLDAAWYSRCATTIANDGRLAANGPQPSTALQALVDHAKLPLWCDTADELQALRMLRVASEFERAAVVIGSGMEFRRLAALATAKVPFVLPLQFPEAPDVSTAAAIEQVSLRHLQSWEQAPTNSKRLLDAGATIAWTTARLRDKKTFRTAMRDAMACGITPDQALAALTTIPSKLLGIESRTGTIEVGKLANLCVVQGDLFDPETPIREVWVGGQRHRIEAAKDAGLDGTWALTPWPAADANATTTLSIDGSKLQLRTGDKETKTTGVQREATQLEFRVESGVHGNEGPLWVRLRREGNAITGTARGDLERTFLFAGTRDTTPKPDKTETTDKKSKDSKPAFVPPALTALPTPLGGYGLLERPAARTFAIVGADLWTCDGRGILRNGAILVRDGKITFAGPRESLPALPTGTETIDGTGKQLTPGIIDCHSHTGISRGVNEGGQAVTAEVRVQDVIDPDDINWYRQLAGGVTAVNQLHGSANAIGGQNSTVKNRWGVLDPNEMRFENAPAGIKFALGENPRRANGSENNPRYPNTRMGVEGLLRDRFAAAEAYRRQLAEYEALSPQQRAKVLPPRRDLELDALAEVVAGTRRIHCHSYRQDEIFMLCQLAQEYGIRIGTFQHVLEGYKVADAIAKNAIGASSFSDWWAYKFEVYDAIPENGAIMNEMGVLVSFNSDSNEYARRLNTEAGKAVKYGNVRPTEALWFVTRNPAIQLGIFERTGSLTAGKDADLALWSGDPLSYTSRCEATWVDGRMLFSIDQDRAARAAVTAERQRLLAKVLASGGSPSKRGPDAKDAYWAAEDQTLDYCCRDAEGGR
jgi:imidazolonepropionase-like amidohydrolase